MTYMLQFLFSYMHYDLVMFYKLDIISGVNVDFCIAVFCEGAKHWNSKKMFAKKVLTKL